jgi:hypothetical protein
MRSIRKWARKNGSYSNPVFGAMVILGGMIMPTMHASAALQEPVQPMAQTAEQVVDALNAVETGVTVDQAFGVQPLPYRDFTKTWKSTYEQLFETAYPSGGDAYLFDLEIALGLSDFTPFQGHTSQGQDFEFEVAQLIEPDYFQDDVSDEDEADDYDDD